MFASSALVGYLPSTVDECARRYERSAASFVMHPSLTASHMPLGGRGTDGNSSFRPVRASEPNHDQPEASGPIGAWCATLARRSARGTHAWYASCSSMIAYPLTYSQSESAVTMPCEVVREGDEALTSPNVGSESAVGMPRHRAAVNAVSSLSFGLLSDRQVLAGRCIMAGPQLKPSFPSETPGDDGVVATRRARVIAVLIGAVSPRVRAEALPGLLAPSPAVTFETSVADALRGAIACSPMSPECAGSQE